MTWKCIWNSVRIKKKKKQKKQLFQHKQTSDRQKKKQKQKKPLPHKNFTIAGSNSRYGMPKAGIKYCVCKNNYFLLSTGSW